MDPQQLEQLKEALAGMSQMIAKLQEAMPGDAAAEQEGELEEATVESEQPEAVGDEDEEKRLKKAAAVAMLSKSLPQ